MSRFRYVPVVGFYSLLALIALHQPLFHAPTHVPGAEVTDYYHFHWNYWWIRYALANDLNIYMTSHVMAPFTSNLAYHTLTPIWFPLWALLEPLVGTVRAMNGIFMVALTLNGLVFFTFLRTQGVTVGLALVGGVLIMLAPNLWVAVYWTNLNLLNWFWLPGAILLWRQVVMTVRITWALLLGVMLWAMILSDLQYAIFALFFVAPYGIWTLSHTPARGRLIGLGIGAVVIAFCLLWLAGPLPYLDGIDANALSPTPAERAYALGFPQGWLWNTGSGGLAVSLGAVILPLTLLSLVIGWSARTRRDMLTPPRIFWGLVALLPLILTAGTQIPLFYAAFHSLFNGQFRYPERFSMVAMMALAVVAMQSLSPVITRRRLSRYVVPGLLLLIVADSRLFQSLPLHPLQPAYSIYEQLGAETANYVVLEVPAGASSGEGIVGEREFSELQFYGLTHGKRMVNGHISRVPIHHYWYMRTDDPLFAWLGGRRLLEPELAEARLAEIIPAYPVGYVMVHTDLIARYTGQVTVQEVTGYLNSLRDYLCPPQVEGDLLAYRTTWHPGGCESRRPPLSDDGAYRIDLGTASDRAFIGWGWYFAEEIVPGLDARWTGAPHAVDPDALRAYLYLDLPPADYEVTMAAQAFQQMIEMTLLVNGAVVGTADVLPDALQLVTAHIPAETLGDGTHLTLAIQYDAAYPAGERDLALMIDWISFTPVDD